MSCARQLQQEDIADAGTLGWEMPVCSVSLPWGSEMEWNRYGGRQGSVISDAFCYPESYLQISGKNLKKGRIKFT